MQRMVTPGKGIAAEEGTNGHTYQYAQQGCENRPGTYYFDIIGALCLIASLREFRDMTNGTHRDAKACGLRDKGDGRIEERHETHTRRTEQQGSKFIAYKAHDYIESLYAAKDSCVFQHLAVGAFLVFTHLLFIT